MLLDTLRLQPGTDCLILFGGEDTGSEKSTRSSR